MNKTLPILSIKVRMLFYSNELLLLVWANGSQGCSMNLLMFGRVTELWTNVWQCDRAMDKCFQPKNPT